MEDLQQARTNLEQEKQKLAEARDTLEIERNKNLEYQNEIEQEKKRLSSQQFIRRSNDINTLRDRQKALLDINKSAEFTSLRNKELEEYEQRVLKPYEQDLTNVESQISEQEQLQKDYEIARKMATKGNIFGLSQRQKELYSNIKKNISSLQARSEGIKELKAQGLQPVFIRGELQGLQDTIGSQSVGLSELEGTRKALEFQQMESVGIKESLPMSTASIEDLKPIPVQRLDSQISQSQVQVPKQEEFKFIIPDKKGGTTLNIGWVIRKGGEKTVEVVEKAIVNPLKFLSTYPKTNIKGLDNVSREERYGSKYFDMVANKIKTVSNKPVSASTAGYDILFLPALGTGFITRNKDIFVSQFGKETYFVKPSELLKPTYPKNIPTNPEPTYQDFINSAKNKGIYKQNLYLADVKTPEIQRLSLKLNKNIVQTPEPTKADLVNSLKKYNMYNQNIDLTNVKLKTPEIQRLSLKLNKNIVQTPEPTKADLVNSLKKYNMYRPQIYLDNIKPAKPYKTIKTIKDFSNEIKPISAKSNQLLVFEEKPLSVQESKIVQSDYYGKGTYERTEEFIPRLKKGQSQSGSNSVLELVTEPNLKLANTNTLYVGSTSLLSERTISPTGYNLLNILKQQQDNKQKYKLKSNLKELESYKLKEDQINIPAIALIPTQVNLTKQESQQRQLEKLKSVQRNIPKTELRIPLLPISGEKELLNFFREEKAKAYDVYVKERGKFKKIADDLPRNMAEKKGADYVLNNLSNRFKLIEQKNKVSKIKDIEYEPSSNVFRNYQIRKNQRVPLKDEWIELSGSKREPTIKKGARLGSRSEVSQILGIKKKGKGVFNLI